MKKLICMIILAAMGFTLAACDSSPDNKSSDGADTNTGVVSDTDTADADVSADAASDDKEGALELAKIYIGVMPFSHGGLVQQLEFEGYTYEAAVYAADNCGADFREEALKAAANYLSVVPFSHTALIDQLVFDKYLNADAVYAADNCGADYSEQAARAAENYLAFGEYSEDELFAKHIGDGFTETEAQYAVSLHLS